MRTGGLFSPDEELGDRYVCLGGTTDCREAPPSRPGEQTGFEPADALTNLFARL